MEVNIEETPAASTKSPSFFTGAQGFSIGTQYNVGQQILELKAEQGTLNPIPDASYSRNRRVSPPDSNCLPGTRQDLIKKVATWVDSSLFVKQNGHIMWLYGYVGCGKSAIAQAVAEKFAEKRRLAASFFFFRGSGDRSKAARFAATIASQVSAAIPATAPLIQAALKAEISLLEPTASLRTQFQRLVFEPIKATKWDRMGWNMLRGPYLIVLDGLDECDDREDIAAFIEQTVDFFNKNPRVPLRFLISSRVEEHIRTRLGSNNQVQMVNLVDHTTREDITIALRAAFAGAARHDRVLQAYGEWPSPKDLGQLVSHIGRSFIFMSTIVKFILDTTGDGLTPKTRLPLALDMNPGLDGLYTQTLMRSQHLPYSHDVIWTLSMLKEPLSIIELAHILELETFEAIAVLVNLHSIFQVPGDDTTPVTFCHTSLRDFLDSKARSKVFKTPQHHYERLGYRCIEIVGAGDDDSPAFRYAEMHWETHWRDVAHAFRSDGVSRRRETVVLISRLRATFPPHCLDVLATYILINPALLLDDKIVFNRVRLPSHDTVNESVLAEFLKSKAPPKHTNLIVRAMNMLRFFRRWDDRSELETIWQSITPPLPPLASYHRMIASVGETHLFKWHYSQNTKLSLRMGGSADSQTSPMVFALAFMSWTEHLALALQYGPPAAWASLNEEHVSHLLGAGIDSSGTDTIVSRILLHLAGRKSDKTRDAFLYNIKLAIQSVEAVMPPDAETVGDRERIWTWHHALETGWHFETQESWHELNTLAAFSVLAKCLGRDCRPDSPSHPSGCPLTVADAALPDSQE